ncbi:MAG TPA: choice-of-anchor tandem repeat GloVer-containing protein [Candidatus Eisenbacteria bacterium]|nr:choice-of-anchor tandem repeat GloVer-containing protein [Candidatus Eisenbacteria bacterium]
MGDIKAVRVACSAAVLFMLSATLLSAQTFQTLVNFNGTDGADPTSSLVQGLDGSLYGTTYGDAYNKDPYGKVFSIDASGTMSVFYNFCYQSNCLDGMKPYGGLVLGTDGNFYGTTVYGGTTGVGTVFKINPEGELTTLYSFCPEGLPRCIDGANPQGGLAQGADGSFYGTTQGGGANCYSVLSYGCGSVFKITPTGELTTIYSFCPQDNCTGGVSPVGSLLLGTDGSLYGVATGGGSANAGTIFSITSTGSFTTIYSFCQKLLCADGKFPSGGLVQNTDGALYGTTSAGGAFSDVGTIFKITLRGELTTLYRFCEDIRSGPGLPPNWFSKCPDGIDPVEGLVLSSNRNFYGITYAGGILQNATNNCDYSCGTIFRITPQGQLTTLHRFDGSDGNQPVGGLFQATNGKIYGTTYFGGTVCFYCGTVFQLGLGLDPFVLANPGFGKPGRVIQILGDQLAETSAVTFNGAPARFEVISDTLIKATVPPAATTGTIEVTTATGTLESNVAFHVLP